MQLLLDDESGIPIPLDDFAREAWAVQLGRAEANHGVEQLCERLAECFAISLACCLDADLQPPSEAQVRYATDISRNLGISLPAEALRFRGAMYDFLERFAEVHRTRRRGSLPNPDQLLYGTCWFVRRAIGIRPPIPFWATALRAHAEHAGATPGSLIVRFLPDEPSHAEGVAGMGLTPFSTVT